MFSRKGGILVRNSVLLLFISFIIVGCLPREDPTHTSDSSKFGDSMDFHTNGKVDSKGKLSVEKTVSNQAWIDIYTPQSELLRLLNDLKDDVRHPNGVQLSNYRIPESLFKGTGWKRHDYFHSEPFGFYHARSEDYFYSTFTQLSYLDVMAGYNEEIHGFELQMKINHGLVLEYDHNTGQLNVVHHNMGLIFKNLQLAHGKLNGDHVYINEKADGVFSEENTGQKPRALGQYHLFEQTPEHQRLLNNGQVVHTISFDFTGCTMRHNGDWGSLRGKIYGYPNIDTVNWSYKYTAAMY